MIKTLTKTTKIIICALVKSLLTAQKVRIINDLKVTEVSTAKPLNRNIKEAHIITTCEIQHQKTTPLTKIKRKQKIKKY